MNRNKGTWIVEEITNEKNRYAIDDDGYPVATVVGEANANLIASAPELLAFAQKWVEFKNGAEIDMKELWFMATQAIAKAEDK